VIEREREKLTFVVKEYGGIKIGQRVVYPPGPGTYRVEEISVSKGGVWISAAGPSGSLGCYIQSVRPLTDEDRKVEGLMPPTTKKPRDEARVCFQKIRDMLDEAEEDLPDDRYAWLVDRVGADLDARAAMIGGEGDDDVDEDGSRVLREGASRQAAVVTPRLPSLSGARHYAQVDEEPETP